MSERVKKPVALDQKKSVTIAEPTLPSQKLIKSENIELICCCLTSLIWQENGLLVLMGAGGALEGYG
jgi:hypothetical protein